MNGETEWLISKGTVGMWSEAERPSPVESIHEVERGENQTAFLRSRLSRTIVK